MKIDANGDREVVLASASDYYPFGMQMPGRSRSTSSYRYGFNGKEKDDKGEFGSTVYDYGFRIYNPQIAKFLSVDPLTSSYPWYTPYQFAGNKPIAYIDLDGLEEWHYLLHLFKQYIGLGPDPTTAEEADMENRERVYVQENLDHVKELAEAYNKVYGVIPGYSMMFEALAKEDYAAATLFGIIDIGGTSVLRPVARVLKPGANFIYKFVGGQIDNLISISFKYGDETQDIVAATGKIDGTGEVITVLTESSLENGIKVVDDIIGGLGDDALEVTGKKGRGMFQNKVIGKESTNGSKGYRIDYDDKKGAHINWWTPDEKGAVLLESSENQIKQILDNEIMK